MNLVGFLFGAGFGFVMVAAGLHRYDNIHNMLLLRDFYNYLMLGSAVVLGAVLLRVLQSRGWVTPLGGRMLLSPAAVERRHVYGAVLFGTGWAIAGTCPAPALAMLATGGLLGLLVVAGLFVGIALRDAVADRATNEQPRRLEPQADPVGL